MYSIIFVCGWVILAWILSVVLTSKQSWPAAYGLMALGLPILIWLGVDHGWEASALGFGIGCLVLRWPVIYAGRWIRRRFGDG